MTTAVLTKENEEAVRKLLQDICGSMVSEFVKENMALYRESLIPEGSDKTDGIINAPASTYGVRTPNTVEELLRAGGISQRHVQSAENVQRMVRAVAASKGDPDRATRWYKDNYGADDEVYKALAATDATAGGFIVPEQMSADIIELLRPASRFRTMQPQIEGMDTGVMRIGRITSGSAATYIAENQNMTATEPVFGQVVASAKKLAALVPISNDLIRRRNASSTIVRDDLIAALAEKSDLAFIRSDGTNGEPKGMRYWAASANVLNQTNHGGPALTEQVLGDLGTMIQTLMDANARMLRPGWMFAPRTWTAFLTMTSSTGQPILREEIVAGRLFGFGFAVSSQIPTNLSVTGAADSEVYLSDFADLVIAEQEQLILDASGDAAYHDGSNVIAAYSQDQTVVRAIMEHDLVSRHEETIVVLSDCDWAAGITT